MASTPCTGRRLEQGEESPGKHSHNRCRPLTPPSIGSLSPLWGAGQCRAPVIIPTWQNYDTPLYKAEGKIELFSRVDLDSQGSHPLLAGQGTLLHSLLSPLQPAMAL